MTTPRPTRVLVSAGHGEGKSAAFAMRLVEHAFAQGIGARKGVED